MFHLYSVLQTNVDSIWSRLWANMWETACGAYDHLAEADV